MSKDESMEAEKAVEQTLFKLVNSTKKHKDKERLKARIDGTLRRLRDLEKMQA